MIDYKNTNFDIIIQAGQSNNDGRGIGRTNDEFLSDERILYMNKDFCLTKAEEVLGPNGKVNNSALSFAQKYIQSGRLASNRKLLILRAAVGGTGFKDGHWTKDGDLFIKLSEMILQSKALNLNNKFITLLWHQGETDAQLNADYESHYSNLKYLFEAVRKISECELLPIIAGDLVHEWKAFNTVISKPVVDAISGVCNDMPLVAFVKTDGLTSNNQEMSNGDIIHFSRQAQTDLGKRYYEAFNNIVKKL